MYYKSNTNRILLASRKIKVRVALITSIEIPMMNERSVFEKSVTRLNIKLKHEKETFLHAIGPVSFDWSTSTPHVYSLSLPSKKDSIGGGSSLALSVSKGSIWNGFTKQNEEFITNFNYSSIVGVAHKNGDARVSVKMAIEYPYEYNSETNFFYDTVKIKVTDKLTMSVPLFIEHPTNEPHIYILPPLAKNKIVTNKDTKVTLAYAVQTCAHYDKGHECTKDGDEVVFSLSEGQNYDYDESPLLRIRDEGYIQTLDKYGKATVIIEENNSLENQIVMLNIMISQIYSISIEKPYTALNLPMGSETNLKITLQEENARSFADKIEGVELFIQNSHPHIVETTLDKYNSTLSLNALGIGEANIKVFTKDNVFDVIRVKVLSSVLPHSPVQLHIGGEVNFIFADNESPANTRWETKHTGILSVDPVYGTTTGKQEGVGEITINSNSVSLITIVNVKKVDRIEMDLSTKPEFFTTVKTNKYYKDEYQVLLNVFLEDGLSEVYPEYIVNGKPLIKHKIRLTAETESHDFAIVFIKVINNRYVLNIRPRLNENPGRSLPNMLKIIITATSELSTSYKYQETFQIPFVSFFYIKESTRDLRFYGDERFKSIEVTSNADFDVHVEGNSNLINYRIEEKYDQNNYDIQFSVPSSVRDDFSDLKVRVSSPLAEQSETFYLSFYKNPKSHYSHIEYTSQSQVVPPPVQSAPDAYPHQVENDYWSRAVSMIIIAIIVIGFLLVGCYLLCFNRQNEYYDLSDNSVSDSDNRYRRQSPRKSGNRGLKLRHHYRD